MNSKRINILITGLGGGSHGVEILKALKLSNLPYYFIGTDINKFSYGFSLVNKSYVVPRADHPKYIKVLVHICKENNVDVLFHGSEFVLKVISKNRKVFQDLGIFLPINSPELIDLCMDKYETMKLLKKEKINIPKTFLISSIKDVENIDIYPVVCKPHIGGGGSNNVFIAQNNKELRLISEYLLGYLDSFIFQEYIGTVDSEYTVGVLTDLKGKIIDSIAVKRYILSTLSNRVKVLNKSGRKELGKILAVSSGISQGEIGRFREVTKYCEKIALCINARGPINFQCRVFNKKVYIFEINPRFSGTTSLRAMMGFNEPDILIRKYVLGQNINRVSYKEGVILRGLKEILVRKA